MVESLSQSPMRGRNRSSEGYEPTLKQLERIRRKNLEALGVDWRHSLESE